MAKEQALKWHTAKKKIKDLVPYQGNPRQMTVAQANNLRKSIEKFDLVEIPAVDVDGTIIAGHQRINVLNQLGRGNEVIDVRIPNRKLTQREFEEYNLRSNKNLGEWDYGLLANFNAGLLKVVGFTKEEIDKAFDLVEEDDFDAGEEYEKIKKPKTKIGDLYQLGEHFLLCGDATVKEDLEKLTQGNLARLIFTDPPYNVDYKSSAGLSYDSKKYGGSGGKIFNDKKSEEDCIKFYTETLRNIYEFTTDDVTLYWWFANKNNWINRIAFAEADWHMSQILVWVKNGPVFSRGQDYHRMYEPVMLGWKRKHKHYTNKTISNLKDVFNTEFDDFLLMLDAWFEKRDVTQQYLHPTQKPVRLAERALKKNSQRGDIVLDVFGGSFSTMLACHQLDRVFYGLELDPKYCDVGILRMLRFDSKIEIKKNGKIINKRLWLN